MAIAAQDDFADIAKPIPKGMRVGVYAQPGDDFADIAKPVRPSGPDYAALSRNERGEGLYHMGSPQGISLAIPYSKVQLATQQGFKIDPHDNDRYANDYIYAEKQKNPNVKAENLKMPEVMPETFGHKALRIGIDQLPNIGGIAGGLGAGALTSWTGPGAVAAGVAGAAAGGAAGKLAEDKLNEWIFGDPTKDVGAEAKSMAGEGALQGAYELGGRALAKPLSMASSYLKPAITKAAQSGIRLLPSEAAGRAASYLEKYIKGSVVSAKTMEKFRDEQIADSTKAIANLANQLGTPAGAGATSKDFGEALRAGIDLWKNQFHQAQSVLYKHIDQIASGVQASTVGIKNAAKQELKTIGGANAFDPVLTAKRRMLEDIIQNPDTVSFTHMRNIRSELAEHVRGFRSQDGLAGKEEGLAKHLFNMADDAMVDAANNSGNQQLLSKVRAANAFTKAAHEKFEHKLIDDIVHSDKPEAIAGLIAKTSGGKTSIGIDETNDLISMLTPQMHEKVQRQVILDLGEKAIRKGRLNEQRFANSVLDLGEQRGQAIFAANWPKVKELTGLMRNISGPSTLGGGGTGAAFSNMTMIKGLLLTLPAAATGLALGGGDIKTSGLYAAGALALEAGAIKGLAWAITHPADAERVLKLGRMLIQVPRTAVPGAIGVMRSSGLQNTRDARNNPQAEGEPPVENPPNKTYWQVAANPGGHRIGTDDGEVWYDIETGNRVN
jgi:hypothetical protein